MRTFLSIIAGASALALGACTDSAAPEAEGGSPAPAAASTAPATAGETSADSAAPAGDVPTDAATARPATAARDVESNPPGDACGASKVASFVSQEATPAVRSRLKAEVGHDRIRWVGPDTVVTMDFRPDRLNVMLDANDIITGGKCS